MRLMRLLRGYKKGDFAKIYVMLSNGELVGHVLLAVKLLEFLKIHCSY